ncbi:unnamed protein product [Ceratitis capitata]|uniref:(Mediterranean fruit fly) hypothetical protein n=1 Tax=Ceratitis capitata TaxID=7213 RepID=A0A811UNW8_CERCA|nr:unnamed protein product [Ceratitis capitata]
MRRTPESRKSTKLENSLWHYQKFFRELKQRRIDFMQLKNLRKFRFGIIYSDCLVAENLRTKTKTTIQIINANAATTTGKQRQRQTQTQKLRENLKQNQGQVQVTVAVEGDNSSHKQHASEGRKRTTVRTTASRATTSLAENTTNASTKCVDSSNSESTRLCESVTRSSATRDCTTALEDTETVIIKSWLGNRSTIEPMPRLTRMPLIELANVTTQPLVLV